MLQFYFLSVLLNVLAGLVLVYATDFAEKNGADSVADDGSAPAVDAAGGTASRFLKGGALFDEPTFRLVLAIVSVLVGIMKLFFVVQNNVPVIGDLVPAVAGIFAGVTLLLEFYAARNSVGASFPAVVQKVFFDGRRYIGVFCIIAGLLHFVFPRVLFL